ncbi:hypothetical protein LLE49_12890, partial [Alicyclobacillus tolerans]|uniref:hypothetical protein n=1 Tax=Alicyclobacillus tolerans TaxID=90970 RepID=UPI001F2254F5
FWTTNPSISRQLTPSTFGHCALAVTSHYKPIRFLKPFNYHFAVHKYCLSIGFDAKVHAWPSENGIGAVATFEDGKQLWFAPSSEPIHWPFDVEH